ncbi:hypothetical protein Cni_G10714 [Canna indica]|uniref:Uncharacterized protein n=1 Tax=Canna indica TaxID=4628 RepID=A0AAQ3QAX8_9LILI|nr:hypothetical protein Cni_G10714 [Canna indica]
MEGLIPFVYRVVVRRSHGAGNAPPLKTMLFNDSPSASYMRLPAGDSGRLLLSSEIQLFSSTSSVPSSAARTTTAAASPEDDQVNEGRRG